MTNITVEPTCAVCEKPAEPDNRLKAGAHVKYCYMWRRRNNPNAPQCPTDGCADPQSDPKLGLCNKCAQRTRRAARGATQTQRGLYESNVGKTCTTEWCGESADAKGLCHACADWSRRNGGADPTNRRYRYGRTGADIMTMVLAIEPDHVTGCRIVDGVFGTNGQGYPNASVNGKLQSITRVVLSEKLGRKLAPEMKACHTCDTPSCASPDHLWEGTHQDNMNDRDAKGRNARGERTSVAKLTDDDVRMIRATYDRNSAELSDMYGVTQATIMKVVNRKSWTHVE